MFQIKQQNASLEEEKIYFVAFGGHKAYESGAE